MHLLCKLIISVVACTNNVRVVGLLGVLTELTAKSELYLSHPYRPSQLFQCYMQKHWKARSACMGTRVTGILCKDIDTCWPSPSNQSCYRQIAGYQLINRHESVIDRPACKHLYRHAAVQSYCPPKGMVVVANCLWVSHARWHCVLFGCCYEPPEDLLQ